MAQAKVTYLRCHCSFHCPASRPEKTKKYVMNCTAYMNVTERIDGVTVEHCLTYLGHEACPSQLRLVVTNPTQRQWLRKYGQRALCVDDTFNLTSYALRLATVIAADEWDRALPAAYLLSYRMTEAEVGLLFEHVKKYLPSFHTDYFMTDDTNTFWNGYSKAFSSSSTKRLLCLWHVQQAMKRNSNTKLINRDLFEPLLRKLKEIRLVRNRNVFVAKYTSMLRYLRENEESGLASYMENSWSDRVEQWAAFGRLRSCVNTSMLCERFHKTLKHEVLD
ncbi:hypothetical protein RB195_023644 [Necator americanus]|uniref:MULE transposase domain-containing protein n=1 Tax=Necator americanus TaxID=51031 RepID=A0ABR1EK24_NECAM